MSSSSKYMITTLAIAASVFAAVPARASDSMGSAEKLRRLDIMLMVTSLRCRSTVDNFNAEYGRFTSSHMAELNRANAQLRGDMAIRYGATGAARQLDRLSTVMANEYGQGHPWLSCRDLKAVANDLASVDGPEILVEAAEQLLASERGSRLAYTLR
jgi:hypothetical protein